MTPAPTLHTKRLTLRGPIKSDLEPLTDMIVSSKRMDIMGGNGTAKDGWRTMMSGIGHWNWHGYGFFVLTDRDGGQALGRVGILNHYGWPEPELAYHVFDASEGRSLAFEAACAVRHWAGEAKGLGPLISLVAPANTRSRALAERLGATVEREDTHDDEPVLIYRHLAHDDPAAQAQYAKVAA